LAMAAMMDLAGHVTMRMLRRYSHIQLEAERAANQALADRPHTLISAEVAEKANAVKHSTKPSEKGEMESLPGEFTESNGRPVGTRTPDLYRVKVVPANNLQASPQ